MWTVEDTLFQYAKFKAQGQSRQLRLLYPKPCQGLHAFPAPHDQALPGAEIPLDLALMATDDLRKLAATMDLSNAGPQVGRVLRIRSALNTFNDFQLSDAPLKPCKPSASTMRSSQYNLLTVLLALLKIFLVSWLPCGKLLLVCHMNVSSLREEAASLRIRAANWVSITDFVEILYNKDKYLPSASLYKLARTSPLSSRHKEHLCLLIEKIR